MKKKILASILTIVFFLSIISLPTIKVSATQSKSGNFYSANLTGNPASDMVAVAVAQAGRTKAQLGYTEAWCADFVSDCAKIAGQSSAIPFNGGVKYLYEAVINAGGQRVSSPQAGDLLFYYCNTESAWTHVALMKSSTLSIQGNVNGIVYDNLIPGYYIDSNGHKIGSGLQAIYVRPNYKSAVDTIPPTITNVHFSEQTASYFTITYTLSDNVNVVADSITFYCPNEYWINSNDSGNGTWSRTFKWEDMPDGDYYCTITAWDAARNSSTVTSPTITKRTPDTTSPTISNVQVTDISETGYTVTCNVSDNIGVTKVEFPTWTVNNGQDDLVWHQGTISGNTATCRINVSAHNGELNADYITHIYAYDAAGNAAHANQSNYSCLAVFVQKKAVKLSKTVITELTNSSQRTMTVKYKAVKNKEGYSIEYSTNSKFKKNNTRVTTGSTVKKIGKLTKGNIYYVRVRAYARDTSGKLVYSPWSTVQKVKIKK